MPNRILNVNGVFESITFWTVQTISLSSKWTNTILVEMVDQLTIQTIGILLTGLTVSIAAIYYTLTLRYTRKNQQMQLETRQAQLYMSLLDRWNTKEFSKQRYDCYRMEWADLDDFSEKYNPRNNPEIFASWNTFGRSITSLASLMRKGLIDLDFLDEMMLNDVINWWMCFGPLEKESWEKGDPNFPSHFPFIKEVVEHDRKHRPYRYDENGNRIVPPIRTWLRLEEMDLSKLQRK